MGSLLGPKFCCLVPLLFFFFQVCCWMFLQHRAFYKAKTREGDKNSLSEVNALMKTYSKVSREVGST